MFFLTEVLIDDLAGRSGADPGFFLGGGALISCSTSTPINHIVFFCRTPVVLDRRSSQWGGGGMCTPCSLPLDLPLEVVDPLCPVAFLFVGCIVILKLLYRKKIIIKEMLGKMP